jgi:zinc protease
LNQKAKEWISYENMVVIASGPEAEDIKHLTEEQAFGIINRVKAMAIAPYVDEAVSTSLLAEIPKGSKVKKTQELSVLQAEEWVLKNGIKVVYRYSDIEKDRVYLSAQSKGGSSLYDVEYLPSAQMTSLVGEFGLGDYDPTTLRKMLAGKKVKVSPYVGELSEGINANTIPQDIETMFQLLYMTFEQPRFDTTLFNSTMTQYYSYLENKKNDPKSAIKDSIATITTGYHPRTLLFDKAFLDQVSLEKIEKIYRERFADANDFTFYITGNITKDELQPLVETYIGGLKVVKGNENWVDNGVKMPEGAIHKDIKVTMNTPKATVSIKYGNAKMTYTPENILYAKFLSDILSLRYTEKVREEEGGTYGVGVRCSMGQFPENEAALSIGFDSAPEKVKDLVPIIYRELEMIANDGPTQEDLDKVVITSKKNRSQAFEKNGFWLGAMRSHYWRGMDVISTSYHEDIVAKITPADIKAFTAELLEKSDKVELVFLPKENLTKE